MSKRPKVVLTNIWRNRIEHTVNIGKHVCVWGTFILTVLAFALANQAGWFGPQEQARYETHSTFSIHAAADGQSRYEAADAVSDELREELLKTVYSDPDTAMEAVTGELAGNPAFAHAVNVCWHHRYGKVSRRTGAGLHRTFWRKDYHGYRYTTTYHEVLQHPGGYQPVNTFKIRTNLRYC